MILFASMPKRFKLLLIILIAVALRFSGLNWDQNSHLHPDERFLTMVAAALKQPSSLFQYLDTSSSPLNPANVGYSFFVYGTFPLLLVKAFADLLKLNDYDNLVLVGRFISAVFDIGTLIIVYKIAKAIYNNAESNDSESKDNHFPLLAAFIYAIFVLPIQLSHYFAVDTFLNFFLALSFYFLLQLMKGVLRNKNDIAIESVALGVSLGLAIACKISAVLLGPIIACAFLFTFLFKLGEQKLLKTLFKLFSSSLVVIVFTYLSLRVFGPYYFSSKKFFYPFPSKQYLESFKALRSFDDPKSTFPPALQWINTKPIIYPLRTNIYYGLGIPLGLVALTAFIGVFLQFLMVPFTYHKGKLKPLLVLKSLRQYLKTNYPLLLIFLWVGWQFSYQGIQFSKSMRYFVIIYPFLAILSANFLNKLFYRLDKYKYSFFKVIPYVFYLLLSIYPVAFSSVYRQPLTRVSASKWIYQNIPPNSTLANEHWDDPLPVNVRGENNNSYQSEMLALYDGDTPEKWQKINEQLEKTDYIILSSSRLYGSILNVSERYPLAKKYYESLFDGSLGFKKVAEFTSRPNIPIPFIKLCLTLPGENYGYLAKSVQECNRLGISIVDDYTDESFTVYDHPKVIIFKKKTL